MLRQVPRIYGNPQKIHDFHFSISPSQAVCLEASATWQLNDPTHCDHVQEEKTHPVLLQIGARGAIPCSFTGEDFCHWIGTSDEVAVAPNYLGILLLGWCYILSVRLVEMRGEGATMEYTASKSTGYNESAHASVDEIIDIGDADDGAFQW